jgi:hypothetical protein
MSRPIRQAPRSSPAARGRAPRSVLRTAPRAAVLAAAATLAGAGPALAQTYDPQGRASPLILLEAPADGVAYFEALERARALTAAGRWAEVEALGARLTREYPRDPETWTLLARARMQQNKGREAAAAYEQAGRLIGWDLEFANGYRAAAAYLRAGDRRAALDALRHMIVDRGGYWRQTLRETFAPLFDPLKDDPEFLALTARAAPPAVARDEGWRRDIAFLLAEAKRVNPEYRHAPFPAEVTRRAEQLTRDVPRLTDEQLYVGLRGMLAPLHQGHVAFWPFPGTRHLPLRLYAFPEGVFVIEAAAPYRALVGARVVAFGDVPAEEAFRRLSALRSVDGDMQHVWGVDELAEVALLRGIGAASSPDSVRLTVQPPGAPKGRTTPVTVAAADSTIAERLDRLVAPPGVAAPLFLSDLGRVHWERALPAHDALYVQLNNLSNAPGESLPAYGRRLWATLAERPPANLVLDLRHNNGGTTQRYPELLRTLIAYTRVPGRQLYVLIGRRTYSAAGNFVTDLERLADPIFVGEATSECCNLYGDPAAVTLPYSRVQVEVTAVRWQLSTPSDRRRELSPEVPVQLTAADYFAGRDPVLAAVYRLIAARNAAARPAAAGAP